MRLRTLAFLITSFLALPLFAQTTSLLDAGLRDKAEARVSAGAYPSVVIGIIHGDQREIVGFGTITDASKSKPDGDTLYEIGSVTKTFTALLLADAVQREEVELDDPVQSLLPDYKIPASGTRMITFRDLATQSSGLPRLPENLLPKDTANPYADYTAAQLKQFLASYKLPRAPGKQYEYSNLGFGLLGQALTQHAGVRYGELVRARITAPLAMTDTVVTIPPQVADRFAAGHDSAGKPQAPWDLGAMEGAGALRSTANDLVRYVQAMMHPPTGPLEKAIALVKQPQRPTEDPNRMIGLAWQIETRNGKSVIWHNGMTGGYASFVGFTADGELGVVVLTNISHSVDDLGFAALGSQPVAATSKEMTLPKETLAAYVGRYRLAPNFELAITASESGLTVQATGQPAIPVFASARDEFFYKAVDAQLSFKRDSAGKIESVVLHQNGHDLPGPRVAASVPPPQPTAKPVANATHTEIKVDPAELARYVGSYSLAPGFLLNITLENGQLYAQATAQQRVPIYPSARNEFFYRIVDAQLTFHRDAKDTVDSVVLHQNGRDLPGAKQ